MVEGPSSQEKRIVIVFGKKASQFTHFDNDSLSDLARMVEKSFIGNKAVINDVIFQ